MSAGVSATFPHRTFCLLRRVQFFHSSRRIWELVFIAPQLHPWKGSWDWGKTCGCSSRSMTNKDLGAKLWKRANNSLAGASTAPVLSLISQNVQAHTLCVINHCYFVWLQNLLTWLTANSLVSGKIFIWKDLFFLGQWKFFASNLTCSNCTWLYVKINTCKLNYICTFIEVCISYTLNKYSSAAKNPLRFTKQVDLVMCL